MHPRPSLLHLMRGIVLAAAIGTTVALGPLRDALVYAPNGAEVDAGASETGAVPLRRAQ